MYCAKNRVDIMREIMTLRESYKPAIIPTIKREALKFSNEINEGGLLKSNVESFEVLDAEGTGDDAIVDAAIRFKSAVITNDRELRRRLKDVGVRVFSLRKGKRIDTE